MGLFDGLFGGGQPQVVSGLSDWQQSALSPYKRQVKRFGQNYDPQFFPGQTYADQSPFTQMAIQGLGGFSTQPSQQYMSDVLAGQYLGLSPSMQAAVMNPAIEASNAAFNQMGRFGSRANVENTSEAAMRALMPYYDAERARMGQAAMALPGLQQAQLGSQLQAGGLEEQYAQQPIDEAMARFQFEQQQPLQRMQGWSSLFGPLLATPNTVQPGGGSTLSGLLGLGMAGASLAGGLGWTPFATAAAGGLLGGGSYAPTTIPGMNLNTFNQFGVY